MQILAMGVVASSGAQDLSEDHGRYDYQKERQGLISIHKGAQWIDVEIFIGAFYLSVNDVSRLIIKMRKHS